MIIDAIVLAGGRATRLGGASKPALAIDGRTLLSLTLAAVSDARRIVVVGDHAEILLADPDAGNHDPVITIVRESPPFAGPAAAIAAGFAALDSASPSAPASDSPFASPSDFTVVVGCDMPAVGRAIDVLLASVRAGSGRASTDSYTAHGAVAVSSDGRPQQLVGVYSTRGLGACIAGHRGAGDLANLSVRALLAGLNPALVAVPEGSTDDVDTWADASRLGVLSPQPPQPR